MRDIFHLAALSEVRCIFLSGKGGCGKTTCSAALALQLVKTGKRVLLLSTDPAHSLGDVLRAPLTSDAPEEIDIGRSAGRGKLWAMEVDSTAMAERELADIIGPNLEHVAMVDDMKRLLADLIPTEAVALTSILQLIKSRTYDVIVVDTAATGVTIRLVQLPNFLAVGFEKIAALASVLGGEILAQHAIAARVLEGIIQYRAKFDAVGAMLRDEVRTKFVVVCVAEHLSVFESARLMGALHRSAIACEHVIINMLLPTDFVTLAGDAAALEEKSARSAADAGAADAQRRVRRACELCAARTRHQSKHVAQLIEAVGDGVAVLRLPLLDDEVRGVAPLLRFSENLVRPCAALHSRATSCASALVNAAASLHGSPAAGSPRGSATASPLALLLAELRAAPPLCAAAAAAPILSGGAARSRLRHGGGAMQRPTPGGGARSAPTGAIRGAAAMSARGATLTAPSSDAATSGTTDAAAGGAEDVDAAAFSRLQSVLLSPNGVALLLETQEAARMQKDAKTRGDYALQRFFRAVKMNGATGAMSFLSNSGVVASLKRVAPAVLAELSAAGKLSDDPGAPGGAASPQRMMAHTSGRPIKPLASTQLPFSASRSSPSERAPAGVRATQPGTQPGIHMRAPLSAPSSSRTELEHPPNGGCLPLSAAEQHRRSSGGEAPAPAVEPRRTVASRIGEKGGRFPGSTLGRGGQRQGRTQLRSPLPAAAESRRGRSPPGSSSRSTLRSPNSSPGGKTSTRRPITLVEREQGPLDGLERGSAPSSQLGKGNGAAGRGVLLSPQTALLVDIDMSKNSGSLPADRDYSEHCTARSLLERSGEKRWMTTPLPKNEVVAVDIELPGPAQIRELTVRTTDRNRELRLVGEAADGTTVELQPFKAFPSLEVISLRRGDGCAVVKLRLETRHVYRWGSMNAGVDQFVVRGLLA